MARQRTSEEAGYSTLGLPVYRAVARITCTRCKVVVIQPGQLFSLGKSYAAICRTCKPFEIDGNSVERSLPPKQDSHGNRNRYSRTRREAARECECGRPKNEFFTYCALCDTEFEAHRRIRLADDAARYAFESRQTLDEMRERGELREQRMPKSDQPAVPLHIYSGPPPAAPGSDPNKRKW